MYSCKLCRQPVQKNYDHVGDCESGKCSGTFEHCGAFVIACPNRTRDLGHTEVFYAPRARAAGPGPKSRE